MCGLGRDRFGQHELLPYRPTPWCIKTYIWPSSTRPYLLADTKKVWHLRHLLRRCLAAGKLPRWYIFIILETGDVQRHRALCEYGDIKNAVFYYYFYLVLTRGWPHQREVMLSSASSWRMVLVKTRHSPLRQLFWPEQEQVHALLLDLGDHAWPSPKYQPQLHGGWPLQVCPRLVLRSVETQKQEDVSVMSLGHRPANQQQQHDGSHFNSAIDILLVVEKQNQAPLGETWSLLPILTDNISTASTSLCKYNTLKIQHHG